jgi:hypothetical protein
VITCPHCGCDVERGPSPTPAQRGYFFGVLVEILRTECGYALRREAYEWAVRWLLCFPWEEIRPSLADDAVTRDELSEVIDRLCAAMILDLQRTVPDPDPDPVRRIMTRAGIARDEVTA